MDWMEVSGTFSLVHHPRVRRRYFAGRWAFRRRATSRGQRIISAAYPLCTCSLAPAFNATFLTNAHERTPHTPQIETCHLQSRYAYTHRFPSFLLEYICTDLNLICFLILTQCPLNRIDVTITLLDTLERGLNAHDMPTNGFASTHLVSTLLPYTFILSKGGTRRRTDAQLYQTKWCRNSHTLPSLHAISFARVVFPLPGQPHTASRTTGTGIAND